MGQQRKVPPNLKKAGQKSKPTNTKVDLSCARNQVPNKSLNTSDTTI